MGSAFSQARQMAHAGLSSMLERLQPQKRSPSWYIQVPLKKLRKKLGSSHSHTEGGAASFS
eukprot:scaffold36585_cov18-Tisochrysis_lutea.AAC.1